VFVPFKHALAGISQALTREGIEHATMSGSTAAGERASIFNAFQNTDKFHVLAAHPQCLAHGVTLTTASTIVWFSPTMSLEIYEQANARIRRVGQKFKQLILHLQSTQVERKMYALLQRKQSVQDQLMEMFELDTA
jgi:SNF2 family DNA or RNA helicase